MMTRAQLHRVAGFAGTLIGLGVVVAFGDVSVWPTLLVSAVCVWALWRETRVTRAGKTRL